MSQLVSHEQTILCSYAFISSSFQINTVSCGNLNLKGSLFYTPCRPLHI